MSPAIPTADRAEPEPVAGVDDEAQTILLLRKRYGTSGQRGEDIDLIRAALGDRAGGTPPSGRGTA